MSRQDLGSSFNTRLAPNGPVDFFFVLSSAVHRCAPSGGHKRYCYFNPENKDAHSYLKLQIYDGKTHQVTFGKNFCFYGNFDFRHTFLPISQLTTKKKSIKFISPRLC